MARCTSANPFCANMAIPRHSRRRFTPATAATASPAAAPRALRWPLPKKPPKPPPPPLLPPLRRPLPTTTDDGRNNHLQEETATASPSAAATGDVLRLMDALHVAPDEDVYISLLRDCTKPAEVAAVRSHITVYFGAIRLPLQLANRLLFAYAACGDTDSARQVFDEMHVKNGITWTTMVVAYSDRCFHQEAMQLFARMCLEALDLTGGWHVHAIVAVVRSCTHVSELGLGEQIHALAVKKRGVCGDLGSSLVQFYCKRGSHSNARRVLEMMRSSFQKPVHEAAWTSLITACHRDHLFREAVDVFRDMARSGITRSSFSLSSILSVCAESSNRGYYGPQVHADAIKRGMDSDRFVGCGLVHMYAKQGRRADAMRAFKAISGTPDAACWNAMVMAYARQMA